MSDFSVARVTIDSPLPQLDRLFDYEVPVELRSEISIGARVKVPFGRSAKPLEAFVVELAEATDYEGKLGAIQEVVSRLGALTPEIYRLCRAVADRQASTIADVIKLAVPTRSVKVEKTFLENQVNTAVEVTKPAGEKRTAISPPYSLVHNGVEVPSWALEICRRAQEKISLGLSLIAVVPDFRDQAILLKAVSDFGLADHSISYSTEQTGSKRYASFLSCLTSKPVIVVGSRAAIYAPVMNLGEIFVYDDGDSNLLEQSSPYIHIREVALIKQNQANCDITFLSHTRSTEVQRLVELGYLTDVTTDFVKPNVAVSEVSSRVDALAWNTIRKALDVGGSVLVQVSAKGHSVSAYCKNCDARAKCNFCNGPLWLDGKRQPRCRWCNAINLQHKCQQCSAFELRSGRAGSQRTAEEFGKAFSGVQIIEASGEKVIEHIEPGKKIVIATAGAEPRITGGYDTVVLLDAQDLLNRDSLRAHEEAVRLWTNAVALMKRGAQAVLVGAAGQLGQQFALWNIGKIAAHELNNRRELRFAPQVRIASLSGESALLEQLVAKAKNFNEVEVLGPITTKDERGGSVDRFLVKYAYSVGSELAEFLKSQSLLITAGTKSFSTKSGRAQRPIRIKMDDSEVV